jgi:hypothetical protein
MQLAARELLFRVGGMSWLIFSANASIQGSPESGPFVQNRQSLGLGVANAASTARIRMGGFRWTLEWSLVGVRTGPGALPGPARQGSYPHSAWLPTYRQLAM